VYCTAGLASTPGNLKQGLAAAAALVVGQSHSSVLPPWPQFIKLCCYHGNPTSVDSENARSTLSSPLSPMVATSHDIVKGFPVPHSTSPAALLGPLTKWTRDAIPFRP